MTTPRLAAIAVAGTSNFRSLAGMPVSGGTIGAHWLLRADHLHELTAAGWQQLQALNMRAIVDLRSTGECEAAPTRLPAGAGIALLHLPVENDFRANPLLARRLGDNASPDDVSRWMMSSYEDFPSLFAPVARRYVSCLMASQGATLVHCTAGKDRTGFAIALILAALGTPEDDIMADYLRSAPRLGLQDPRLPGIARMFKELFDHRLTPEALLPILDVRPEYLAAALARLDRDHGGVHRYLAEQAGLDESALDRLRERAMQAS